MAGQSPAEFESISRRSFAAFLQPAGVALGTGELGILRIDAHEIVTFRIHLIEFFAADRADSGRAARSLAKSAQGRA